MPEVLDIKEEVNVLGADYEAWSIRAASERLQDKDLSRDAIKELFMAYMAIGSILRGNYAE